MFQVVTFLRAIYLLVALTQSLAGYDWLTSASAKGPMKMFIPTFSRGTYICMLNQLFWISYPKTGIKIIEIMNYLLNPGRKYNSLNKYSHQNVHQSETIQPTNSRIIFEASLHVFVMWCVIVSASIPRTILGFKIQLVYYLNLVLDLFGLKTVDYQDMSNTMKFLAVLLFWLQVDMNVQMGVAILQPFTISRILQDIASKFRKNLEFTKSYCAVTNNEVYIALKFSKKRFRL